MQPPLGRSLFELDDAVWALHCAEGPVPRASVAAARAFLEKELRPWDLEDEGWLGPPRHAREEAARLMGGKSGDIAITGSTSAGLTCVAQGYPWREGDEVLAPLGEFPSNVWPWRALAARGVSFREVALWDGHLTGQQALASAPPGAGIDPEERILSAIGERTRLVTVSWVRFQDGLRLDLARLAKGCAARGVDLVVDGIQGAGTLPLDLAGVAAFATGVHKGLLSPQGAGLLWTAPGFRERLRPTGSWLSVEAGGDFRRPCTDFARAWLPDGRKFEQGAFGGLMLVAVVESLKALNSAGPEAIARHVDGLQALLLERVRSTFAQDAQRLDGLRRAGRLGSILSFHHRGAGAEALAARVAEGERRRIFASVREGYLRIALHGWHDPRDVERIAQWLSE